MSKCRKPSMKPLKTYFSLIIEHGMYFKCLQKPRCLVGLKEANASAPTRRKQIKVEFLERQCHSKKRSIRLSTKRKMSILLNFLFPFVFFIGVISILKCKTLVFKTTTWWTRASHFVDGWRLQKCHIHFFPHHLNGWHDHWTFVGDSGMGNFTDLVWEFFPKPLWS